MLREVTKAVLATLRDTLRSRAALVAENTLLRQQVISSTEPRPTLASRPATASLSAPSPSCSRRSSLPSPFRRRVKGFGTKCLATPPRAPQANSCCERVIRTLRRECLDNVIIADERHAERVLRESIRYYHGRPHRGLHTRAPLGARWLPPVRPTPASAVRSVPILGGLHHEYTIAA